MPQFPVVSTAPPPLPPTPEKSSRRSSKTTIHNSSSSSSSSSAPTPIPIKQPKAIVRVHKHASKEPKSAPEPKHPRKSPVFTPFDAKVLQELSSAPGTFSIQDLEAIRSRLLLPARDKVIADRNLQPGSLERTLIEELVYLLDSHVALFAGRSRSSLHPHWYVSSFFFPSSFSFSIRFDLIQLSFEKEFTRRHAGNTRAVACDWTAAVGRERAVLCAVSRV
ncbi:MAG: hypothetical protein Q8P67_04015 [archaeon]|nr:hypothetical protein [archaeon]